MTHSEVHEVSLTKLHNWYIARSVFDKTAQLIYCTKPVWHNCTTDILHEVSLTKLHNWYIARSVFDKTAQLIYCTKCLWENFTTDILHEVSFTKLHNWYIARSVFDKTAQLIYCTKSLWKNCTTDILHEVSLQNCTTDILHEVSLTKLHNWYIARSLYNKTTQLIYSLNHLSCNGIDTIFYSFWSCDTRFLPNIWFTPIIWCTKERAESLSSHAVGKCAHNVVYMKYKLLFIWSTICCLYEVQVVVYMKYKLLFIWSTSCCLYELKIVVYMK
jgi:lysozyme family protein